MTQKKRFNSTHRRGWGRGFPFWKITRATYEEIPTRLTRMSAAPLASCPGDTPLPTATTAAVPLAHPRLLPTRSLPLRLAPVSLGDPTLITAATSAPPSQLLRLLIESSETRAFLPPPPPPLLPSPPVAPPPPLPLPSGLALLVALGLFFAF